MVDIMVGIVVGIVVGMYIGAKGHLLNQRDVGSNGDPKFGLLNQSSHGNYFPT